LPSEDRALPCANLFRPFGALHRPYGHHNLARGIAPSVLTIRFCPNDAHRAQARDLRSPNPGTPQRERKERVVDAILGAHRESKPSPIPFFLVLLLSIKENQSLSLWGYFW